MRILSGKKQTELSADEVRKRALSYARVCVDVGTGSGRYVFNQAKENPDCFYIGLDPAADNMEQYAVKAEKYFKKNPNRNLLYIIASIESLPDGLEGIADRVMVQLPWGSLRDGIVLADSSVLSGLRVLGHPGSQLHILVCYDEQKEEYEMKRRGLPQLSAEFFENISGLYLKEGIEVLRVRVIGNTELRQVETDWARRLAYGRVREVYEIECKIIHRHR